MKISNTDGFPKMFRDDNKELTCLASWSTSTDTSEIARRADWILALRRISISRRSTLVGSWTRMTFDRSLTPHMSKYSSFLLSLPRNISTCSDGCSPVSVVRSFFTSPIIINGSQSVQSNIKIKIKSLTTINFSKGISHDVQVGEIQTNILKVNII